MESTKKRAPDWKAIVENNQAQKILSDLISQVREESVAIINTPRRRLSVTRSDSSAISWTQTTHSRERSRSIARKGEYSINLEASSVGPVLEESDERTLELIRKLREEKRQQSMAEELKRAEERRLQEERERQQAEQVFLDLRNRMNEIEQNVRIGEEKVLENDRLAFAMKQGQWSVSNLAAMHQLTIANRKVVHKEMLIARSERKDRKRQSRNNIRATKKRDMIIQQQDKLAIASQRIRDAISEKRKAFERSINHMQKLHYTQNVNLIASQGRNAEIEKSLLEIETHHMKEEQKSASVKNFQLRRNNKSQVDKRVLENLREVQLLETQHTKERFELELMAYEEIENRKINHQNIREVTVLRHLSELHAEKEAVLARKEAIKEEVIIKEQKKEITRMMHEQKKDNAALKAKLDSELGHLVFGSRIASRLASKIGSKIPSRQSRYSQAGGSNNGSYSDLNFALDDGKALNLGLKSALNERIFEEDNEEEEESNDPTQKPKTIVALTLRQKKELNALDSDLKKEINDLKVMYDAKLEELAENQKTRVETMVTEQERLLKEMIEIQEKEIVFEETMTANEMKMLIERRILNSVLETVNDAIICISPSGSVIRFNQEAEKIFGWKATEIIGQNIKVIVPSDHAEKHQQYMNNYLTTGIRKVIGKGRTLNGMKKDGTLVPLHLSLSEVKEHGEHMFTGIIRDLTESSQSRVARAQLELENQKQISSLSKSLEEEQSKCKQLLYSMVPEVISGKLKEKKKVKTEAFPECTVVHIDISQTHQLADFLNPLEFITIFGKFNESIEEIIESYDIYRAEHSGQEIILVVGAPTESPDHAKIGLNVAYHLVQFASNFKVHSFPNFVMELHITVSSGQITGTLLKSEKPRYVFLGEALNMAQTMQSTSSPNLVQVSNVTRKLCLDKSFVFEARDPAESIANKAKTIWLTSYTGFTANVFQ